MSVDRCTSYATLTFIEITPGFYHKECRIRIHNMDYANQKVDGEYEPRDTSKLNFGRVHSLLSRLVVFVSGSKFNHVFVMARNLGNCCMLEFL